jgi:hypothetical protein
VKVRADAESLALAVERLRSLSDPMSTGPCGLPPVVKDAVSIYVRTHILPLVEDVERDLRGAVR